MDSFSEVKVGDDVVVIRRDSARLASVIKVTATQITTKGGDRWMRRNGYLVGDSDTYRRSWIMVKDEQSLEMLAQRQVQSAFKAAGLLLGKIPMPNQSKQSLPLARELRDWLSKCPVPIDGRYPAEVAMKWMPLPGDVA